MPDDEKITQAAMDALVAEDTRIINEMIRAMCEADGVRWFDVPARCWRNWVPGGRVHLNEDVYRPIARRQLAAHRAMVKAEKEQGE